MGRHGDDQGRSAASRGIEFTRDGKFVMVAVGDDDTIQMIDTKTQQQVVDDSCPPAPTPELFTQDAAGGAILCSSPTRTTTPSPSSISRSGHGLAIFRSASGPRNDHQSGRQDPDQYIRDDQHGAFPSTPRPVRSSPTCWSTRGRAFLRNSSMTAPNCGFPLRDRRHGFDRRSGQTCCRRQSHLRYSRIYAARPSSRSGSP